MTSLSRKELAAYPSSLYSLLRDIAANPGGPPRKNLAAEISIDLARGNTLLAEIDDESERAVLVSTALLMRTLAVGTYGLGGAFLADDVDVMDMSLMLRPASVCVRAGATVLPILQTPISIPRETSATTFSWLPEVGTVTAADSIVGALNLGSHKIMGATSLSSQLSAQVGAILTAKLVASLQAGLGAAFDAAALAGSGVSGSPLGIFNEAGTGSVTFGGAATLAKAIDFQTQPLNNDGRVDRLAYVAPPNVRAKWLAIPQFANGSDTLWEEDETVIGRPAFTTTAVPAASILCGDFSTMYLAFFAPTNEPAIRVVVNPFSSALAGQIQLVVSALGDAGVIRPNLFVKSADSAVQ
jgi:HK97 family phage major capsid protein